MANPMPSQEVLDIVRRGTVIPAHPLALTRDGAFDERHQRALTRYYCAAGAGGLAVGVHTTQFEIRQPQHGLFKPVLELAKETADACAASLGRPVVLVGGICGKTPQALEEAAFLKETGYDAGLLSLAALKEETVPELIAAANGSAVLLATVLADGMAMYRDPGFFKRAQLAPATLAVAGLLIKPAQDAMLNLFSKKTTAVMTNVPGPREKLKFLGATLEQNLFWVPQSGTVGMGVSILSYGGGVQFGVMTDSTLCPDPQKIIDEFEPEFAKLAMVTLMLPWGE